MSAKFCETVADAVVQEPLLAQSVQEELSE